MAGIMRDRTTGSVPLLVCIVSLCGACATTPADMVSQPDGPPAAPLAAPSDAGDEDGKPSDGDTCTFWPDGSWGGCCTEHDRKYRAGGSFKERWAADNELFGCMSRESGSFLFAAVAWLGVRVGAAGFLPTPFRWGFGHPFFGSSEKP